MSTPTIKLTRLFYPILILACIINFHNAYALETDKSAPLTIQANHAEVDRKQAISIYQGNVKVKQGSMSLLAERLVIEHPQQRLSIITATGSPAYYRTQPHAGDIPILAHAKTIVYDANKALVTLIGDAFLQQGENQSSSQRIVYDIKKDYVKAYRDPTGKQISITINPDKK